MEGFEIVFWYWWVAAVLLLTVEMLAPGFFFMWMAISAFIVGCIVLLIPAASADVQLLLFSVLAVVSILVWNRMVKPIPAETDHPLLNKRGAQYIGRVFTLQEAIVNGGGKIKVDDSIWKVRGKDCSAGSRVRVIAVTGTVLEVRKLERDGA